jgi:hypothetical protein
VLSEHGNKSSGPIRRREFLDYLSEYTLGNVLGNNNIKSEPLCNFRRKIIPFEIFSLR